MNELKLVLYLSGTIGLFLLVIMALLRALRIVVSWAVYKGVGGQTVLGQFTLKSMLFSMHLAIMLSEAVLCILLLRLVWVVLKF